MTATYGTLSIFVAVPTDPEVEATGDPALDVWASFLKAYINAHGAAAWAAAFPRSLSATAIPPVLKTFTHQPTDESIAVFNERYLPCLFLYRAGGAEQKWEMIDWRVARDTITLLWVFPTGAQAADRIRVPFVNALVKLIDAGIESYHDPAWTYPGDPDPKAATIAADVDSIKTSIATSALAQVYSGAALDGIIGTTVFVQPRAFTVTLTGPGSAFVNGSTITVTGLDVLGRTHTRIITIATGTLPATFATDYAFTKITSITVAAQADVTGFFEFGLGLYQGRGSMVLNFTPHGLRRVGSWKAQPINIPVQHDARTVPRYYDAVEIPLEAFEVWRPDAPTLNGIEGTLSANQGAYEQEIRVPVP